MNAPEKHHEDCDGWHGDTNATMQPCTTCNPAGEGRPIAPWETPACSRKLKLAEALGAECADEAIDRGLLDGERQSRENVVEIVRTRPADLLLPGDFDALLMEVGEDRDGTYRRALARGYRRRVIEVLNEGEC